MRRGEARHNLVVHPIVKLLDHKLDNKMLLETESYWRVAFYINILFGKRLYSNKDVQIKIYEVMQSRKAK